MQKWIDLNRIILIISAYFQNKTNKKTRESGVKRMKFLSFLKSMKIEDNCPIDVTFRTSRSCSALGLGFIGAGLSMAWQICAGNKLLCFFSLVWLGSIGASMLLALIGGMIMTYRKTVVISKRKTKIDVEESGLLVHHSASYHFLDILQIEVCPMAECLLTAKACMWTIKGYVRRHEGFDTVRLYCGRNIADTIEAASLISQIVGCPVINDVAVARALSFTREVGNI